MTTLPVKLPPGFSPQVKEGDAVKAGHILAKKNAVPDAVIKVAEELAIDTKEVPKTIKKNPGDSIQPGEVLAAKGGLFGEKKVVSSIAGTVVRFERDSGNLVIRGEGAEASAEGEEKKDAENTLLSPLDGTVTLCNNDTILIETDKDVIAADKGIGEPVEGEFVKADGLSRGEKVIEEVLPADLTPELIGKVIIGGKCNREVLVKAVGMGIAGVVALEISDEDLDFFTSKNIKATIVSLNAETMKEALKWVGKSVFVDGKGKTILLLHYENKRA